MGALPKNKITRVEQGKRRRGNSPKLKKDLNSVIPMHKQGFTAELLRFIGLGAKSAPKTAEAKAPVTKKAPDSAEAGRSAKVAAPKAKPIKGGGTVKATRVTQHKG